MVCGAREGGRGRTVVHGKLRGKAVEESQTMECPHRTRKGTIQTRRDVFKGEDAAEPADAADGRARWGG